MFYVYVLELANNKFYIGQSNNIENRLLRHQNGQCRATKPYRPVKLMYSWEYQTRSEAMQSEKYLKSLKSHQALNNIINSSGGPIV